MRRAAVLTLVAGLLAGCGGSEDVAAPETTPTTSTSDAPPGSYEELLERLPPFDVPASDEVAAYREATIGAFFERCVPGSGGADKASFVKANRALLDRAGVFPGARLFSEFSIEHRDNNGCLEGTGPPTSYSTDRNYHLPKGADGQDVIRHYGRRFGGWRRAFAAGHCEQTFTRGEDLIYVRVCPVQQGGRVVPADTVRLSARAAPVRVPAPPKLPPRPYGAQYPLVADAGATPEPMSYEVEPGETCERMSTHDVPSVIIPPTPGIRAEFKDEPPTVGGGGSIDQHVLVEWSFDEIHGDCPPTQLLLTIPNPKTGQPPFGIHADVQARSGTEEIPIPDSFSEAYILWATAESIDGHRGRTVSVLLRR